VARKALNSRGKKWQRPSGIRYTNYTDSGGSLHELLYHHNRGFLQPTNKAVPVYRNAFNSDEDGPAAHMT
jgi:hypothetical protein